MNIKQLETFVRIVEQGTFSGAAKSLFTTQSTISARIQELERHIGVKLFDRTYHRAQLTPKGQAFVPYAKQLVDFVASISHEIGGAETLSGVARIGVVGVIAMTWLPKLVTEIRTKYPRATLKIDMSLTRSLVDKLRDGHLDLAFVAGPIGDASLKSYSLGFEEFVWMASPSLGVTESVRTPRDLLQWPILSLAEESRHYPVVEDWFRENGAVYRTAIDCTNMRVIADLTMRGLGVSLLPRNCFRREVRSGKLKLLRTKPEIPPVEFLVTTRSNVNHPLISAIVERAMAVTDLRSR